MANTTLRKFKVYCHDYQQYAYQWSLAPPTTCPFDGKHSVDSNMVHTVDRVPSETVTSAQSPYSLGNRSVVADTENANLVLQLPKASTCDQGSYVVFKLVAANTVTVAAAPGETIDLQETVELKGIGSAVHVRSNGSFWGVVQASSQDIVANDVKFLNASKKQIGLGNVVDLKETFEGAAGPPQATDDDAKGYAPGSRWLRDSRVYTCTDATTGAANWSECTGGNVQQVKLQTFVITTGSVLVDMPGTSITTNTQRTARHRVSFVGMFLSNKAKHSMFALLVNGVNVQQFWCNNPKTYRWSTIAMNYLTDPIPSGTVIKIQYSSTGSMATYCYTRNLIVAEVTS